MNKQGNANTNAAELLLLLCFLPLELGATAELEELRLLLQCHADKQELKIAGGVVLLLLGLLPLAA